MEQNFDILLRGQSDSTIGSMSAMHAADLSSISDIPYNNTFEPTRSDPWMKYQELSPEHQEPNQIDLLQFMSYSYKGWCLWFWSTKLLPFTTSRNLIPSTKIFMTLGVHLITPFSGNRLFKMNIKLSKYRLRVIQKLHEAPMT